MRHNKRNQDTKLQLRKARKLIKQYKHIIATMKNVNRSTRVAAPPHPATLPLRTPQAMALWAKVRAHGWVDDSLQPTISQTKAAVLAMVMDEYLNLTPRWQPFEQLWHLDRLANRLCNA